MSHSIRNLTLLLLVCVATCFSSRTNLQTIDDWQAADDTLIIIVEAGQTFPIAQEQYTLGTSDQIIGRERDLQVYVTEGTPGSIVSVSVNPGMGLATPATAFGGITMQYDGLDGSMDLNPVGLNIDLTAFGADAIILQGSSDHPVDVTITITSANDKVSTHQFIMPPTDEMVDYEIKFTEFTGNADFTKVGSISINLLADRNIDVQLNLVCTSGPDRVYFIEPICNSYYDFSAQCYIDPKENDQNEENGSSSEVTTDDSDTSTDHESEIHNIYLSLSLLVQQYFSFSWDNAVVIDTTQSNTFVIDSSALHHLASDASRNGAILLVALLLPALAIL